MAAESEGGFGVGTYESADKNQFTESNLYSPPQIEELSDGEKGKQKVLVYQNGHGCRYLLPEGGFVKLCLYIPDNLGRLIEVNHKPDDDLTEALRKVVYQSGNEEVIKFFNDNLLIS